MTEPARGDRPCAVPRCCRRSAALRAAGRRRPALGDASACPAPARCPPVTGRRRRRPTLARGSAGRSGWCGLAGVVALLAAARRRPGRRRRVLLVVGGGALAWSPRGRRPGGRGCWAPADVPVVVGTPVDRVDRGLAGRSTVAGAGCLLAPSRGCSTAVRGRRWPALGRRYERAGAPGADALPADQRTDERARAACWEALDRGEDPTDPRWTLAARIADPSGRSAPVHRPRDLAWTSCRPTRPLGGADRRCQASTVPGRTAGRERARRHPGRGARGPRRPRRRRSRSTSSRPRPRDARPRARRARRAARARRRGDRRGQAAQPVARARWPRSPTRPRSPATTRPAAPRHQRAHRGAPVRRQPGRPRRGPGARRRAGAAQGLRRLQLPALEARAHGADLVLLIVAALEQNALVSLRRARPSRWA